MQSRTADMGIHPMAKVTKPQSRSSRKPARALQSISASVREDALRPGGKLGLIVDRLSTKTGVTADELVAATGWQRHSVLGALSKLKSRGFAFHLDATASRKAYRLTASKG